MFLASFFKWWYGEGWLSRIKLIRNRLAMSADFFSVGLLASSLFAPYRQISAGSVSGPIGDKVRAFFDKLISRMVGAVVRSFMIIFGLATMFFQALFGLVELLVWLAMPTLPVIGLILMVIGWVPQWKI